MNEIEKNEDTMHDRQVIVNFLEWFNKYSDGNAFAEKRNVLQGDYFFQLDKADCLADHSETVLDEYFCIDRAKLEKELKPEASGFSNTLLSLLISAAIASYVCACHWLAIICERFPKWGYASTAIGWMIVCALVLLAIRPLFNRVRER